MPLTTPDRLTLIPGGDASVVTVTDQERFLIEQGGFIAESTLHLIEKEVGRVLELVDGGTLLTFGESLDGSRVEE